MTKQEIIELALECNASVNRFRYDGSEVASVMFLTEELERFAALVAAKERDRIIDEWSMCVQSDLEHGVKSLNEQAAIKWRKDYPAISTFDDFLSGV